MTPAPDSVNRGKMISDLHLLQTLVQTVIIKVRCGDSLKENEEYFEMISESLAQIVELNGLLMHKNKSKGGAK